MEQLDAVDYTMGFSGVVREISKALNDPDEPLYDRIPPSREAVAQYMELYNMNGDPEELEQIVDFNYAHSYTPFYDSELFSPMPCLRKSKNLSIVANIFSS